MPWDCLTGAMPALASVVLSGLAFGSCVLADQ